MEKRMNQIKEMYKSLGISESAYDYGTEILAGLKVRFEQIDEVAEYNQLKVVKAMQECQVSEACLLGTTGYGYNDLGRDTLEAVYAKVFHTEDALVRPQITCGTHALALALMSNLRPGDELLSPVGKPYDTLEEVIGIRPSKGSLAEYGVSYRSLDALLAESDYISVNVPLCDETRGMFGDAQFAQMKKNCVFINIARGPIVDLHALRRALDHGVIAGAGIDVYDSEPCTDSPLVGCKNAVLTPHVASFTSENFIAMNNRAAQNVLDFLNGTLDPKYRLI